MNESMLADPNVILDQDVLLENIAHRFSFNPASYVNEAHQRPARYIYIHRPLMRVKSTTYVKSSYAPPCLTIAVTTRCACVR